MKRSRWRPAALALLSLALLMLAAQLLLPLWITRLINQQLEHMGDYQGHIAGVELALYRGAYRIQDLQIRKRQASAATPPLLRAPLIDLSIRWRDLWHGAVVGEVAFLRPQLNLVDAERKQDRQFGGGVDWRAQLEALLPIHINELRVQDGSLQFLRAGEGPLAHIVLEALQLRARNLRNVEKQPGQRVADFDLQARLPGGAPLQAQARFDPFAGLNNFSFDLRIRDLNLHELNGLARAYTRLDVAQGQGELVMQLRAQQAVVDGYAKLLLHQLKIFDWRQDVEQEHKNPLQLGWEALAQALTSLFKNHPADQFATRVPIHGSLDHPRTNKWQALIGILHNAFVEAYHDGFEQQLAPGRAASSVQRETPP